jgi:hypothetical protein
VTKTCGKVIALRPPGVKVVLIAKRLHLLDMKMRKGSKKSFFVPVVPRVPHRLHRALLESIVLLNRSPT